MIRLMVFDLDSTLAPLGQGIGKREQELFKNLEKKGTRIAICSGKTCDYLCGFMRQIGLENPILIGENGAVMRFGVDLPPMQFYRIPFSKETERALREIQIVLQERFPHIWFQPNKIGVTPFPTSLEEFDEIEKILEVWKKEKEEIQVFRHIDSFDIVPKGINKAIGIQYVLDVLGIEAKDIIAVGDGVNDYCMFEMAGYSIGVNVAEEFRVNKNCNTTLEMLEYLHTLI